MAAVNHNQRTRKALEAHGYDTALVEHWNSFARIRQDLFGMFDVLAVGNHETIGVQITSRSNISSRKTKILANPTTAKVFDAGWRVEIWGWYKDRNRWYPIVRELTAAQLCDTPQLP